MPTRNVVAKPEGLSFAEAACLPTAWLTAYRMLFTQSGLKQGDTVLVQGAGGGVATAAITLARAAGFRVYATSRDEDKREKAVEIGAHEAFESGARLPSKVDAVIETVGAATWSHSVKSMRPGGTIVIAGATSGDAPSHAELTRIFFQQMRVHGSTMGTRDELHALAQFMDVTGTRPLIDREIPMADAADGSRVGHRRQRLRQDRPDALASKTVRSSTRLSWTTSFQAQDGRRSAASSCEGRRSRPGIPSHGSRAGSTRAGSRARRSLVRSTDRPRLDGRTA